MNAIDLTPLYRNSIGFDRLASLLNSTMQGNSAGSGYPPYNIEVLDENRYAITLAVAGFDRQELDISVGNGVLTVRGNKSSEDSGNYLHRGIAHRGFERKFELAEFIEVSGAELKQGLLTIQLVKEVPEAMKPKTIAIEQGAQESLEHKPEVKQAKADQDYAA